MIVLWSVLGVIGSYIGMSIVFTRFPTLLHKKKKHPFHCRNISHRGGAGESLENTMSAFSHAIEQGAEMLEIDVQLTADGEVVVLHDNSLMRTCGESGLISDCQFKDLPLILPTLDVTFSNGQTATSRNGDRKIPLLRSVFEAFPHHPVNIDIKEHNEELMDKTLALIAEFNRKDMVVIGNFNNETINKLHQKDPDIPICFSLRRVLYLVVMFYMGILPFVPLEEGFLEIPLPRIVLRSNTFSDYRCLIRIADWLLMSPILFRHLQRRGVQVYLFVINEEEDFKMCFEKLGATGVMTDYPMKLGAYLNKKDS